MAGSHSHGGSTWQNLTLAAAVIGGGYLTYVAWSTLMKKSKAKGKTPPMPPGHWLFGHIPLLASLMKPGDHLDQAVIVLQKQYPHLGKFWQLDLILFKFIMVNDADAMKEILLTKNYKKSPTYNSLHPFIGARSMVCSEGAVWSKQRKAFSPGFNFQFLKTQVPVFVTKTQSLVKRFKRVADTEEPTKLLDEITLLTLDVIVQVALSLDFKFMDAEKPPAIFDAFMGLLEITSAYSQPHLNWQRYLPWVHAKWQRLQRGFDIEVETVIRKRLANPETEENAKDILSMAIATSKESGEGELDFQDVLAQVKTFLFAGHDTTASSVAFSIYEISCNPEVQTLLLEEVDRVCGGRIPTADDLNELKYMNAVVKETLRMWPPGGTARIAPAGATYNGFDIGLKPLYIGHMMIHRDPDYWGPDAHVFRPSRWQDEAYVAALHPMAYMPFSKGQRDCIGQTFANMEMKTLLAVLYTHFTFKYAGEFPEEQGFQITSHPKYHVPVTIHSRAT